MLKKKSISHSNGVNFKNKLKNGNSFGFQKSGSDSKSHKTYLFSVVSNENRNTFCMHTNAGKQFRQSVQSLANCRRLPLHRL